MASYHTVSYHSTLLEALKTVRDDKYPWHHIHTYEKVTIFQAATIRSTPNCLVIAPSIASYSTVSGDTWDVSQNHQQSAIVTKIAPENKPSQKETNIPTVHFQVLQYVSFREGRVIKLIHSLLVDFSAL